MTAAAAAAAAASRAAGAAAAAAAAAAPTPTWCLGWPRLCGYSRLRAARALPPQPGGVLAARGEVVAPTGHVQRDVGAGAALVDVPLPWGLAARASHRG